MTDFYVKHFIEAHEATVADVLTELRKGKKQSHWMWFIFPIINGLSQSYMGTYYAIGSIAEASAFINHNYLGSNYKQCLEAILQNKHKTCLEILDSKVDDEKLRSSLTLFEHLSSDTLTKETIQICLKHFYADKRCKKTLAFLEKHKTKAP